ncbi:MAG TPA: hypothetical protein VFH49_01365, partial [Aquabacterium sp.]|nr:hypothetical protein [Aquabacterium sp.]
MASAFDRIQPWRRLGGWLLIAVSVVACLALTGAEPGKLLDREGLRNAGDILAGLLQPDTTADFLARVWTLAV